MLNNALAFMGRGCVRGFDGAAGAGYGPGMMDFYWGGPIMMIGMIIVTIILVVGIYFIVRHIMKSRENEANNRKTSENTDSAIRLLNERFAKGEISEEDYLRMKKNLMS